MESWYDDNNLMHPFGENGILFTSYQCALSKSIGISKNNEFYEKAALSQTFSKYVLKDSSTTNEPWSSDNHVGILCMNNLMKILTEDPFWDYDQRYFYQYWWRRAHPKHFIFFLYACEKTRLLSYPLLWLMSLLMAITCLDSRINKKVGVLDTDGKMLVWLVLKTYYFPLTTKLCDYCIKYSAGSWENLFHIYFRQWDNHPLRNFSKRAYEINGGNYAKF